MDLKNNDIIPVFCQALSSEGEGIGVYQNFKIFVDGLLPGEEGEILITEKKARYGRGKLLKRLSSSPDRVQPPCPHFAECGGCSLQHLNYDKQLEAKRTRVQESLKRIAHLDDVIVEPCLPSPKELGYRNKIQLPVEGGKIGLFQKGTHQIVSITHCLLQSPFGEKILETLRPFLSDLTSLRYLLIRNAINTQEALLVFITRGGEREKLKKIADRIQRLHPEVKGVIECVNTHDSNVILSNDFYTLSGREMIYEKILDKTFGISPPSFFQVNTHQAELLFQKAIEWADFSKEETLLDAYAGVGLFALLASSHVKMAYGIEIIPDAVRNAQENALRNQIKNVSFTVGLAEKEMHHFLPIDVLFLNPPRKGCDASLLANVIQNPPKKLLYLSCDPATLARDLALLTQGGFHLRKIQPFDMFPQTMHVETLALLTRDL